MRMERALVTCYSAGNILYLALHGAYLIIYICKITINAYLNKKFKNVRGIKQCYANEAIPVRLASCFSRRLRMCFNCRGQIIPDEEGEE